MTPNSGKVGSEVTITIASSSFFLEGPYKLLWSQTADFEMVKPILLKQGNAPKTATEVIDSFTVPESKYGDGYVQFLREYRPDDPVNLKFSVKPALEIIPAQAAPGATVTVKGMGFPIGGTGTVTFDGQATDISIETNEIGTFTAEFVVPVTMAGEHKFVANSAQLLLDSASATMKVIPKITMVPKYPDIGTDAEITGYGFAAHSLVQIKYDNVSIANSPTTDENGIFSFTFNVPEGSTEKHQVSAEDEAGNKAVLGLSLENTPPPKPTPISPKGDRFGYFGNQTITFAWTEVTDMSGVSYTIEVAEDLNFFPLRPGMKKTGLTEPICAMSISSGTYYWRVRAIDGAGNEGEWAISPQAFRVGLFSQWILIIGGIVCAIALALLIRMFIRRLKEYS